VADPKCQVGRKTKEKKKCNYISSIITSVYLIGGLIIGFGALLAKHFCMADTLEREILLANRNMSNEKSELSTRRVKRQS
jgi:hypothetical protein